jgi:hypothetical protein
VVEFIEGKLEELDAEKAELAAFQVGRRADGLRGWLAGHELRRLRAGCRLRGLQPGGRGWNRLHALGPHACVCPLAPLPQALDRQRRSIEYALFDKELADARAKAAKVGGGAAAAALPACWGACRHAERVLAGLLHAPRS